MKKIVAFAGQQMIFQQMQRKVYSGKISRISSERSKAFSKKEKIISGTFYVWFMIVFWLQWCSYRGEDICVGGWTGIVQDLVGGRAN